MRSRHFQLMRLFGIPVKISYSWFLVAALHLVLVTFLYLPRMVWLPRWQYLFAGALMTALVFLSVLVHELSHSLMARLEGVKIYDIELHIFGGWARMAEFRLPLTELRIAIAGPASSFLLALMFYICTEIVQQISPDYELRLPLRETFRYLLVINLLLATFNLLPGLPLDGGRVLRAALWHRRKDILSATQTAKRMGVWLSYMLISYGLFRAFWGDYLSTFWSVMVGVFLKNQAEKEYRYRQQQQADSRAEWAARGQWDVQGTVGAIMSTPAVSVPPDLRISEFIDRILSAHRYASFPVAHNGRLHGLLSLERLRQVPREDWERLFIRDVMQPVDDSLFVPVRASIELAERKLKANRLGRLAVVDSEGLLVGYLSLDDLKR